MPPNRKDGKLRRHRIFLNLPFDRRRRKTYLALIAGLSTLGLTPKCVSELQSVSDRLTKLSDLIGQCAYSFHDLSYLRSSADNQRLNMPFELGLVIGRYGPSGRRHKWWAFEHKKYSLEKLL